MDKVWYNGNLRSPAELADLARNGDISASMALVAYNEAHGKHCSRRKRAITRWLEAQGALEAADTLQETSDSTVRKVMDKSIAKDMLLTYLASTGYDSLEEEMSETHYGRVLQTLVSLAESGKTQAIQELHKILGLYEPEEKRVTVDSPSPLIAFGNEHCDSL